MIIPIVFWFYTDINRDIVESFEKVIQYRGLNEYMSVEYYDEFYFDCVHFYDAILSENKDLIIGQILNGIEE